jgi:thymidylate synthase (FAD)
MKKEEKIPFGINLTKRPVSQKAEMELFESHPLDNSGEIQLVDYMGNDELIEYSATLGLSKCIFPEQPSKQEFMNYLVQKGIYSPFKFAQLKFLIQSPITTALTFVYSQQCSVNEYSGRYSQMPETFHLPNLKNLEQKLGSKEKAQKALELILTSRSQSFENYKNLISEELDLARELSRGILGTNNDTKYYWKIDLLSLSKFIDENERTLPHNSSTRNYLEEIKKIASSFAPEAWHALTTPSKNKIKLTMPSDPKIVDHDLKPPFWQPSKTKRVNVENLEEQLFQIIPFLDHGQFQVIDYMGDDSSFAEAARTSYGKGTKTLTDNQKLVQSLIRDRHTSPIEMTELAFISRSPVFTDPRQFSRHRTLDNNGFMGDTPIGDLFYFPEDSQFKHQDRLNRQGRGKEMDIEEKETSKELLKKSLSQQLKNSHKLRELGLPEEDIRETKGVAFYTKRARTGDAHNLQHMLGLRWDSHAQHEIQVLAEIIANAHKTHTPNAFNAFLTHNKNAITLSSKEINWIQNTGIINPNINPDDLKLYQGVEGFTIKEGTKLGREGKSAQAKLRKLIE